MNQDYPFKVANSVYTGEMAKAVHFRNLHVGDLFKFPGSDGVKIKTRLPNGNPVALDFSYGVIFPVMDDREVIRLPNGTTVHIDQGGQFGA